MFRSSRASLLLLALSLTCTGVLVTGCSGAETQEVLLAANTSPGSTNNTEDPNPGSTDTPDAGTNPTVTCTTEDEPNDSTSTANELDPARCGTLDGDDQKDFLTFRLKPTTGHLSITLTGKVRLRVSVKGKPTAEMTPDKKSEIPFVMDEDYFVEVTALNSGDASVPWRVTIVETE